MEKEKLEKKDVAEKKPYRQPELQKRQRLSEVTGAQGATPLGVSG